jgi:hypothetical protein
LLNRSARSLEADRWSAALSGADLRSALVFPRTVANPAKPCAARTAAVLALLTLFSIPAARAQGQIISIPNATTAGAPSGPAPAPVRPEDQCALEGRVTNAITGEALAKAAIFIGGSAGATSRSYQTATDETGKFQAKGIDPGTYQVSASLNGFVNFRYWDAAGRNLTLTPRQKVDNLSLTLAPAGVISGRVVNANGDPMAGYYVTPLVYKYVGGERVLVEAQGSPVSNDAGSYRVTGLPPGRYYLEAAPGATSSDAEIDRSARPRQEDYVRSFYPAAMDAAGAAPVQVAPGQTLTGLDITVVKARSTFVSGTILNETGAAVRNMTATLTPAPAGVFGMRISAGPQGEYQFRAVPPGTYWLDVQAYMQGRGTRYARQRITVGESPLIANPMVLPAAAIPGAVRVDGNAKLDLKQIKIGMKTPWRDVFGFTVTAAAPDENGAFRLAEINPQHYVLTFQNLPQGFYVKSARFGEVDALENGVDPGGGEAPPLQIVLGAGAPGVAGTVKDASGAAQAEATVALVPTSQARRAQPLFYRSVRTDAAGAYQMTGLIPGEYRVYAFSKIDGEPWTSAEFLRPYESKGQAVTLREGAAPSVDLQVIALEQQP